MSQMYVWKPHVVLVVSPISIFVAETLHINDAFQWLVIRITPLAKKKFTCFPN